MIIKQNLDKRAIEDERDNIEALIIEELRRLHEGVLSRYDLHPSDFSQWKISQDKK